MFVSVLLVTSAPSLFISWLGLELNTLSFIPLLLVVKNKLSSEAAIKYFLTQTLASILFIFGSTLSVLGDTNSFYNILILIALSIKLGAAPFHSWLMSVGEACPWIILLVLLTIQKINPLLIMWGSPCSNLSLYLFIIFLSILVGGFLGLAQTDSRLVLIFSSISHVGWLLTSLIFNLWLGLMYFLIYFFIVTPVVSILSSFNVTHINQLTSLNLNLKMQLSLFISLLSLGGLPPFLGFLPKWAVLQLVMQSELFILGLGLVLMSLFTLYYYLRLSFSALILNSVKFSFKKSLQFISPFSLMLICFSFLGLPVIFIM
nr:NADH dehydrogenase subunit 2 [Ceriodaphnia dubia]